MEKQPKINNEELYQKHRKSAEEIKKARERYDEIIRENQEAGNIELHPEILKEATSLYQEWGKEQLAKALEKQDFQRAKKIIIELEERQRTVEKRETPKWRFVKKKIIKKGKLVGFSEIKFDDKGNKIEEVEKDSEGKIIESWENEYNNEGKMTKAVRKDSEGKLIKSRKYKYNDEGKIIEEVKNDYLEGKLVGSWEYKYNDKGKMIEEVRKDPEGKLVGFWEYKYNDKGKMIEEVEKDSKN